VNPLDTDLFDPLLKSPAISGAVLALFVGILCLLKKALFPPKPMEKLEIRTPWPEVRDQKSEISKDTRAESHPTSDI